jgi:hypothetical protein
MTPTVSLWQRRQSGELHAGLPDERVLSAEDTCGLAEQDAQGRGRAGASGFCCPGQVSGRA